MPAVTLRYLDTKGHYKNRIIVLNKGYLLNAVYIDEKGKAEESWSIAQNFFNTIKANDELHSTSKLVATPTPGVKPAISPLPTPTSTKPLETAPTQYSEPMVSVQVGSKKVEIRQTFKAQMDSLESFFDSYMEFLESPDLSHYAELMIDYAERMEELEDIDESALTDAEYAYYLVVYGRILSRLSLE